jgi:hypothetical protein
MDDFYITLLSDSNIDIYPTNSLSSFRNDIARPVYLERDKWVVGLAELSYSQGFSSLDEEVYEEAVGSNKNIITRAGKIVFQRKDFTDFMDLYNTIRGLVKDKDLQELLLIELQGYLISHQKEIKSLEQNNTAWNPSLPASMYIIIGRRGEGSMEVVEDGGEVTLPHPSDFVAHAQWAWPMTSCERGSYPSKWA